MVSNLGERNRTVSPNFSKTGGEFTGTKGVSSQGQSGNTAGYSPLPDVDDEGVIGAGFLLASLSTLALELQATDENPSQQGEGSGSDLGTEECVWGEEKSVVSGTSGKCGMRSCNKS